MHYTEFLSHIHSHLELTSSAAVFRQIEGCLF